MRKFKFPLQKVLQHRKTLEELAQKDFQEGMAKLIEEQNKLQKMFDEIVGAREHAFKKQVAGGAAGSALSQVHEFMKGQDVRIERQKAKIQHHEQIVEELREILRQRAVDYKIINKLKDKKKEQYDEERSKYEQKLTDDMNIMRYRRKDLP